MTHVDLLSAATWCSEIIRNFILVKEPEKGVYFLFWLKNVCRSISGIKGHTQKSRK